MKETLKEVEGGFENFEKGDSVMKPGGSRRRKKLDASWKEQKEAAGSWRWKLTMAEGSCRKSKAVEQFTTAVHNNSQQFTTVHNNSQQFTTVHNSSLFYTRKPGGSSGMKKPDASWKRQKEGSCRKLKTEAYKGRRKLKEAERDRRSKRRLEKDLSGAFANSPRLSQLSFSFQTSMNEKAALPVLVSIGFKPVRRVAQRRF